MYEVRVYSSQRLVRTHNWIGIRVFCAPVFATMHKKVIMQLSNSKLKVMVLPHLESERLDDFVGLEWLKICECKAFLITTESLILDFDDIKKASMRK